MNIQEQVEHLRTQGYVLIKGALSQSDVERMREAHDNLGEPSRIVPDGNWAYNDIADKNPIFKECIRHPSVDGILNALLGDDYAFYRVGGIKTIVAYSQPWHWDDRQWVEYGQLPLDERPAEPPPTRAHTTFYLDPLTPEHGYLMVPPGSHNKPELLTRPFTPDEGDQRFGPEVKLHPSAGDAIVFISHLPHRGANMTPDTNRRLVVCMYGPHGTTEDG